MNKSKVINCQKIDESHSSVLNQLKKTYLESFPENERRDFESFRKLVKEEERFTVTALFADNVYAGFITSWNFGSFVYVEHFAIDPAARNGGIGAQSMQQFLSQWDVPVILEVELPHDEMSKRRINFYERIGFVLDNHPYKQPPYSKGGNWLDLQLMYYGDIDLQTSYENVKTTLYKHVYNTL